MSVSDEALISERAELIRQNQQLSDEARSLDGVRDLDGARAARRRSSDVKKLYTKILPDVIVARCPETGELVRYPIDIVGLDGWFWDFNNPWRRISHLPASWLTMCGAIRLHEPVAFAPFMCRPGPGVPFVIPRILDHDGVRAVINEIPVGLHTGWAISYFGPRPQGTKLENTWGANVYDIFADDGAWLGVGEHESPVEEYDFDLEPWLESEKLLWIAPGDPDARLRTGTADCPYVGVEGEHRKAGIVRGELRRRR
ncbi:hypothetical protein [Nocardia sp. NBC_01327]|uniref:hypothetical protein n=1 Tax=Nocardia sp. NBC_01327 TaxID=2903593 RepID=UPI002E134684|nr:hypothetical protein OG326_06730 [Nocardia sp. NBC_01327]